MVLVREDQQFGWHALALQRGEGAEALGVGHTVVLLAQHHQHRRLPLRNQVYRAAFLVLGGGLVIGFAAVFPLIEPQFFGGVGHGPGVEHAVVVDQALEPLGPLPLDPVHHIAAVGGAERAGLAAVEIGTQGESGIQALLQVFKRLAAPVTVNRVGEGLAVAGAAMKIDRDHRITLGGEDPRVPAERPGIVERALRTAVDEQQHWQLAGRVRGGVDLPPDGVTPRPGKAEALGLERRQRSESGIVGAAKLHAGLAFGGDEDLGRIVIAVAGEDHAAVLQRNDAADVAFGQAFGGKLEPGDLAASRIDPERRGIEHVLGGDDQRFGIVGPGDRTDRTVPATGQGAALVGLEVH